MTDYRSALEGFAWQGTTLLVENPDKLAKIRRKNLSASVAQNVLKCSASMAADSVLPWVSDPFAPNELGTAAHEVLEHLYELPAPERTKEFVIAQSIRQSLEQWSVTKLADSFTETLDANETLRLDWNTRVTNMALGDFDLEDPTKVDVYKAELDIKGILIGPTKVPFRGFIDRLDRIGADEHGPIFEVNDYKTGQYKPHNPRFSDGYGDQMRLYTVAVEVELGRRPAGANLLYTAAGKRRAIDLSEAALQETLKDFDKAWKLMNSNADAKSFPTKPNNLCGWCNLANACPVAKITSPKAKANVLKLPSKVDLGIPVIPVPAPIDPRIERAARAAQQAAAATGQPVVVVHEKPATAPEHLIPTQRIEATEVIHNLEQETLIMTHLQYPTSEFAAMAAFSLTDTATEHLNERGQVLSPPNIEAFADVLAGIITRAEAEIFGNVGWEHGKHARLNYSLASQLKMRPAPFGDTAEKWAAWESLMHVMLSAKAAIALKLLAKEAFITGAQFAPFVGTGTSAVAAPAPALVGAPA